jgi:carbamoyl-phosphate synthase small subunit
MNALISSVLTPEQMKEEIRKVPSMDGLELSSLVSTKKPYFFGDPKATYKIAALDVGIKTNILRNLAERNCYVQVFPAKTTFGEMDRWEPQGYFYLQRARRSFCNGLRD